MLESAFYATNVLHAEHVVDAMQRVARSVTVAEPWRPNSWLVELARRVPEGRIPRGLERRISLAGRTDHGRHPGLGWAQFLPAVSAAMPRPLPHAVQARLVTRSLARHVESASGLRSASLFQFVEGLGHRALENSSGRVNIMERRNLHHEAFEVDLDVHADFPFVVGLDPIRDELELEYEKSDLIVVYSEIAKRSFLERGYPSSKLHVVPLALPDVLPRKPATRDGRRVLYVGRCDAYKGLDLAAATAALLGADVRLRVAGPARPEVIKWMTSRRNIDYLGILGRQALRDEYEEASVLLAPSIESFGFAVFEAIAYGLPCVTSDQTGISEYIPEEMRCVVAGRNPDVWAESVHQVQRRGGDYAAARTRMEKELTWARSAEAQFDAYQRVLSLGS